MNRLAVLFVVFTVTSPVSALACSDSSVRPQCVIAAAEAKDPGSEPPNPYFKPMPPIIAGELYDVDGDGHDDRPVTILREGLEPGQWVVLNPHGYEVVIGPGFVGFTPNGWGEIYEGDAPWEP